MPYCSDLIMMSVFCQLHPSFYNPILQKSNIIANFLNVYSVQIPRQRPSSWLRWLPGVVVLVMVSLSSRCGSCPALALFSSILLYIVVGSTSVMVTVLSLGELVCFPLWYEAMTSAVLLFDISLSLHCQG